MKVFKYIFSLLLILSLTACSEDFFDQTVEIKVPEHTPQLAITSQMEAGDSAVWLYLTHSQGILENGEATPIENAIVEFYRDGQLLETLPFLSDRFYLKELATPISAETSEYEFKVTASGYAPITAAQRMPVSVPIISGEYEAEGAIDTDGERVDEISIEFQDPAGEENFYQIAVFVVTEFWDNQLYLHKLDPIAEESDDEQFLQDDSFDGKKYTWRVGFYPQHFEPGTEAHFLVQLRAVSRDEYYYQRSVTLSYDADDNPFAEPVIIHSNVEGGQGIFTLSSVSEIIVEP